MPVTNLMKDIVISTLDEVLKKEARDVSRDSKDDIIAYVLNRVPPKYVTSQRGFLYGVLDTRYQVQNRVDVLFLIYEAIYRILDRRDHAGTAKGVTVPETAVYLPHIVGQVLEESTLTVIPDVEVTLLYGAAAAAMVDADWENPYRTTQATKGHFHFWPKYSEGAMKSTSSIPFKLTFRHPHCADQALDLTLNVNSKNDFGISHFIPTVLMKAKNQGKDFPWSQ
ncbi:MAG: late competence development ComFB family protein [Spirochaetes bacterium]|nr:late competence development ComFB family protein [Spirochaetota bacterium]